MDAVPEMPGAAGLVLAGNVVPLDPGPAVLAAMLEGWGRQQRARFLQDRTIAARARLVQQLAEFSGQYPWQWNAAEIEAFFGSLRCGGRPAAASTARGYQVTLRLFLDYLTDARYGWAAVCEQRFGAAPSQVLDAWNTVAHRLDYEGRPGRRPLTYDEVQALLDAADGLAGQARERGRKGELTARRDAALLKCVYAFGAAPAGGVRPGPGRPAAQPEGSGVRPVRGAVRAVGQVLGREPAQAAHRAAGPRDGLGYRGPGPVAG